MPQRFLALSDLHFEFHPDQGRGFLAGLPPTPVDAVLMAGDLSSSRSLAVSLSLACGHFQCPVLYVPGNHDYYGAAFDEVEAILVEAQKRHSNLQVLSNASTTIAGQRILGTTLWFPDHIDNATYEHQLNDFRLIRGFKPRVYEEHAKAETFLRRELQPGDVVISHHLPSPRSIALAYRDSPLNRFFANDLDALIVDRQTTLWVHGHTHASVDYLLGKTRVLCNPYGYLGVEPNRSWNPACIVSA